MNKSALFSDDRKYRYWLSRIWDDTKPKVMFIGLNPSTANEDKDDNTIRRVIGYARDWGYGGVYMCNLFPFVSTDPKLLTDISTHDNDKILNAISRECAACVFAWGAFKQAKEQAARVIKMFPDALVLTFNNDGSPHHPLRLSKSLQPQKFVAR